MHSLFNPPPPPLAFSGVRGDQVERIGRQAARDQRRTGETQTGTDRPAGGPTQHTHRHTDIHLHTAPFPLPSFKINT